VPAAQAQEVSLKGYVKAESIFDTRQVEQVREGQFNLYPLPKADADGDLRDDNATDNLLLNAFQSRLAVLGTDSTMLGVDLSGTIEFDFFGTTNDNVNAVRLRHAYVRIAWPRHEVLVGQYWSPLFTPSVYPQVINFSTGAPFQPFARFPQVSYTFKPGAWRLTATVSQQRDAFQEIGGRKMQQQSGLPAAHLHVERASANWLIGVGGALKSVRPELDGSRFTAGAVLGYGLLNLGWGVIRGKLTYGYDMADHLMTGGFISVDGKTYRCLGVLGSWLDFEVSGRPWSAGIFGGYSTNLGSHHHMGVEPAATMNARAANIKQLWRIAPRAVYATGPLRFAAELEATTATYCSGYTDAFEPMTMSGDKPVVNVRTLLAVYYVF
jgi:hypothetical protein